MRSAKHTVTAGEIRGGDDLLADLLAQVHGQDVLEDRAQQRDGRARRLRVAQPDIAFGGAGPDERPPRDPTQGVRDLGHRVSDDAARLHLRVLGEARLLEAARALDRPDVVLGVHALVRVGDRQAEHSPQASDPLGIDSGPLGHFARRVAGALAGEDARDGEQREAVLGHRLPELVETHAVGVEVVEQRDTRAAGLGVVEPLEQSLGLPVDAHRRGARVGIWRRAMIRTSL
jgi:hypothetical protein